MLRIEPMSRQEACASERAIAAFVGGELESSRVVAFERHIADCAECAAVVAAVADDAESPSAGAQRGAVIAPGLRIGRYVVREQVGSGAMGAVYKAHDPDLDRYVALKLLRPGTGGAEMESRLLREAQAMARLSHPGVITVYDFGRHEAQLFIAMELVAGGTLRTWLDEKPRPWREIVEVFVRAGRGLAEAHAAGLVHRDFKPDNVLVGSGDRVRVTDFGLARTALDVEPHDGVAVAESMPIAALRATLTRTGALLGTPAYMAPEQLRGALADARSDMFAFCVALWEALFGERPFRGVTLKELRASVDACEVRGGTRGRDVPARVRSTLLRGLRAQPEQRFPSMTGLLDALVAASQRPYRRAVAVASALAVASAVAFVARAEGAFVRAAAPPSTAAIVAVDRSETRAPEASRLETRPEEAQPTTASPAAPGNTPAAAPKARSMENRRRAVAPLASAPAPSASTPPAAPTPPDPPAASAPRVGKNGSPIIR